MRKTLNINLGGMAFVIDENAFELLHNYLESLKAKFKNAAERDEILNDIEARIAEMLNQKLEGRKEVLSLEEVQYVISIMGKPEVIAGEEQEDEGDAAAGSSPNGLLGSGNQQHSANTSAAYTTVKRKLFRDPDDAKVGGVIAGLCHYFGIHDPVWVRLAVVILCFISFGTVLLIYFLLLLVIPKAVTSAEKLQMKGEPVNISTIEKEIKGAVNRANESINKLVKEETIFEKLWNVFLAIAKGIFKVIAAIFIIIGLIIIFALLAALFGISVAGNALLAHAPHLFIDNSSALTMLKAGVVLFIGAPVVALIYAALRLIFGNRTQAPRLKWILASAWGVGIFLLIYGGIVVSREFSTHTVKNEEIVLMQPANGTLYVQIADSLGNQLSADEDEDANYGFTCGPGGVIINGTNIDDMERIPIGEPKVQLMPSANDSFYVQKATGTMGKNKGDALTNSGYVIFNFSQRDTILNLPQYLELDKKGKYRGQDLKLRIAIPEGKFVRFAENIDRWKATVKGDRNYDDTYFANTTWTTTNGKVVCVKGENHFNADEDTKKVEEEIEKADKKLEEAEKKLEKKIIKIEKRVKKGDKDESDQDF